MAAHGNHRGLDLARAWALRKHIAHLINREAAAKAFDLVGEPSPDVSIVVCKGETSHSRLRRTTVPDQHQESQH